MVANCASASAANAAQDESENAGHAEHEQVNSRSLWPRAAHASSATAASRPSMRNASIRRVIDRRAHVSDAPAAAPRGCYAAALPTNANISAPACFSPRRTSHTAERPHLQPREKFEGLANLASRESFSSSHTRMPHPVRRDACQFQVRADTPHLCAMSACRSEKARLDACAAHNASSNFIRN